MTPAQRRYIAIETMIGATISAVLSIAFVLLVFGGRAGVTVAGPGGLIVDAVPQGFAIALMATLVPTMLTRRRLARGKVRPIDGRARRRPRPLPIRLLGMAMLGAGLSVAVTVLLVVAEVRYVALPHVLVGKAVWGLLLGGLVAATMTRRALEQG
ncbi:MAG: hypothetical protein PGN08_12095 [Sphingomonas taxi]